MGSKDGRLNVQIQQKEGLFSELLDSSFFFGLCFIDLLEGNFSPPVNGVIRRSSHNIFIFVLR